MAAFSAASLAAYRTSTIVLSPGLQWPLSITPSQKPLVNVQKFFSVNSVDDTTAFPALPLAYEALKAGGTMCAVYNGADEAAVSLFLQRKIDYLEIASVIEGAMRAYTNTEADTLDAVLGADRWAREFVYSKV